MSIIIRFKIFKTISNTSAVEFFDEIESLKKETKKLRDSGVNIIIGLGHSGIEKDQIIAKEVEDIDIIVGGHSHTLLYSGKHSTVLYYFFDNVLTISTSDNSAVFIIVTFKLSLQVSIVSCNYCILFLNL